MNKLEQAARQILEALEGIGFVSDYWNEKVTALREALAEPDIEEMTLTQIAARHDQAEQDPVEVGYVGEFIDPTEDLPAGTKLYAAPLRTKDLTDSEIAELWVEGSTLIEFARAVIAKFKRKNNAA